MNRIKKAFSGVFGGEKVTAHAETELDDETLACDAELACTTVGGTTHCSSFEYCIHSIDQPEPGEYVLNMDCSWEIVQGNGVGGAQIEIDVLLDQSLVKTIDTHDCGSGFVDTISISAPDGGRVTLEGEWDSFGGGSFLLSADLPEPTPQFDPNLVEVVGCSIDPTQFSEDSNEPVNGRATVSNQNDSDAIFEINWFVGDEFLTTAPVLSEGIVIPANTQEFFDFSLPLAFDWPVSHGTYPTEAVITRSQEA